MATLKMVLLGALIAANALFLTGCESDNENQGNNTTSSNASSASNDESTDDHEVPEEWRKVEDILAAEPVQPYRYTVSCRAGKGVIFVEYLNTNGPGGSAGTIYTRSTTNVKCTTQTDNHVADYTQDIDYGKSHSYRVRYYASDMAKVFGADLTIFSPEVTKAALAKSLARYYAAIGAAPILAVDSTPSKPGEKTDKEASATEALKQAITSN